MGTGRQRNTFGHAETDGAASSGNTANFAKLVTSGYDAVKAIYPQAKVIVHIDEGNNPNRYIWLFDGLKADGGKWDVIACHSTLIQRHRTGAS